MCNRGGNVSPVLQNQLTPVLTSSWEFPKMPKLQIFAKLRPGCIDLINRLCFCFVQSHPCFLPSSKVLFFSEYIVSGLFGLFDYLFLRV